MKIFIIGPAHPYRGGIADTNEALARALQRNGHQVKIITFSMQYPDFLFPGKTQFSSDKAPKNLMIERWISSLNPINWIKTAKKINREKPDMVVFRYWLPFLAACFGSISRLLNRKIKIIGFCDNVLPHEKRPGDKILSKYFIKSCDAFLTMSKQVKQELSTFTDKKCITIPHPINDNLGNKIDKAEARKKLGLDIEKKYLLFFGLVRKYKGLDLLLESLARERIKNKNIHLLVAGEFYDDKKEYIDFIEKNGLKEKVKIFNRFIPNDEIKVFFSACDLVTQTYHSASQSGVSQLAFNFGTPILVTNVGGLSEIVEHKKMGYVVSKNPAEIEEAILDFFEEKRSEEFSENIRYVKHRYSWDSFAKGLVEMYE